LALKKNVPIIKFIKNWHWRNIEDHLISPFLFLREKMILVLHTTF